MSPRTSSPLAGSPSALVAALAALALPAAAPSLLSQQEPSPPVPPAAAASVVAPGPGIGVYIGPQACGTAMCHGAVAPRGVYDIRQDEYHVWSLEDPHARSYETLSDERSAVIVRNLGLGRAAREEPSCLACHAFEPPAERLADGWAVEEGISCEACHGPAGGWLGTHDQAGWTRADSIAAGMTETRDPARRAALCLDCHLGGPGRTVDHRLLAAGHPPLTFELDNFAAAVSHWRERAEADGMRGWAVGQVAALERELAAVAARAGRGEWPELSYLRCGDCHHAISEQRWRTAGERGGPVTGLPRWSPARWAALRHVIAAAAPAEEERLGAALAEVARTVGRLGTPPGEVARAAGAAADAAARAMPAVRAARWERQETLAVLAALAADPLAAADAESARQTAFAANSLASALVAADPEVLRGGIPDAVEAIYRSTLDPYDFDRAGFTAALAELASAVARVRGPTAGEETTRRTER